MKAIQKNKKREKQQRIVLAACAAVLLAFVVSAAWASRNVNPTGQEQALNLGDTTLAVQMTVGDMTGQADLIAIGHCVDSRSVWVGRDLVTIASIAVSEIIKGDEYPTVDVVLPGGVDANREVPIAVTWPGAPQISVQEEVFLFLDQDPDLAGRHVVTGFAQGKFSVVTNDRGEKFVARDLSRVALQDGEGWTRGGVRAMSLSRFREEVQSHLQRQGAPQDPRSRSRGMIDG